MIGNFIDAYKRGLECEKLTEIYFVGQNLAYKNVTNIAEYRAIDVDFIADGLGAVEVKKNYHTALKGYPGDFFWIELQVGNSPGWWYKTTADYFIFWGSFDGKENNRFLKIKVLDIKDIVDGLIQNGDHSETGLNRFDYKKDQRSNKIIIAKSMRLYLKQIPRLYQKFVYRSKEPSPKNENI
jgi:hypothetical protein